MNIRVQIWWEWGTRDNPRHVSQEHSFPALPRRGDAIIFEHGDGPEEGYISGTVHDVTFWSDQIPSIHVDIEHADPHPRSRFEPQGDG